jgi:hypothetical protein
MGTCYLAWAVYFYSVVGFLVMSLLFLFVICMVVLGFPAFWFPEKGYFYVNVNINYSPMYLL